MKTHFVLPLTVLLLAGCSSAPKQSQPAASTSEASGAASPFDQTGAPTKKSKASGKSSLVCEKGSDKRTAEVLPDGKGCKVEYEKFGKKSVLASSSHGKHHCRTALAHLDKNLTTAGFVCK